MKCNFVLIVSSADICLNFRTTFVSRSGQVVYSGRLIALNYIKGWFLLDLLAAIPFDFIIAFQNVGNNETWGSPGHIIVSSLLLTSHIEARCHVPSITAEKCDPGGGRCGIIGLIICRGQHELFRIHLSQPILMQGDCDRYFIIKTLISSN